MSEVIVSGTFRSDGSLRAALNALKQKGVELKNISYASAPRTGEKIFDFKPKTKVVQGMAFGMLIGAIAGGLISASQFGGVLLSRLGEPVLTGAWVAASVGAVPGFLLGALMGGMLGRRIPAFEAELLEKSEQENPVLLGVSIDEEKADEIDSLLQSEGATYVCKLDKKFQTEVGL